MAKDVVMPVLGMSQDSGVLVRWLARSGDQVMAGTPLMEVETDKAVVEVDAPATGVLADVSLGEGESAAVGTVIARIYDPSEAPDTREATSSPSGDDEAVAPVAADVPSDVGVPSDPAAEVPTEPPRTDAGDADTDLVPARRVRSSPRARRLAEELGVEIAALAGRGAGPDGAVVAADVATAAASKRAADDRGQDAGAAAPVLRTPLSGRDVVTCSADVDLEALRHLARRFGAASGGPSADDLLVLLVMIAVRGALGPHARVAVRRVGAAERHGVWSGERPVLDWLRGLAPTAVRSDAAGNPVDVVVVDALSTRVRRRGGLASARMLVALAATRSGGATLDLTVEERDVGLAERMLDDLVRVTDDPALAPFVMS